MNFLPQTIPEHAFTQCSPFGHVYVKLPRRNRSTRSLGFQMVPNRSLLRHTDTIRNNGDADDAAAPGSELVPTQGIARGSVNKRRDTSDHKNF